MSGIDLSSLKIENKTATARRSHRTRKLIILSLCIAAVILTLAVKVLLYPTITIETVTVSQVYPSQSFTILNASGYVVAQKKAAVAPKTTGQLQWLGVEEGSRVKSGQLLARLENRDVTASRSHAAAAVATAKANLDQAQVELLDAQRTHLRAKDLVASGVLSQADFDTAEARLNRARGAVKGMESSVASAEAQLAGADASIEYTMIRAPFDAVVLTKNADIGDIVTPIGAAANAKAAVVTLADPSSVQVEADLSESNLGKVKVGQPCEIQLDALPDSRFRGVLHTIVPTADRSKASVMVKVRFLEKGPGILPEMSAKVAFLERAVSLSEQKPRTAVPKDSVIVRSGRKIVFLLTGDKVREVPVIAGEALGDYIEITEGIKAGQVIVRKPSEKLNDGGKVKQAEKK